MASPVKFEESNAELAGPQGMPDCLPLPVWRGSYERGAVPAKVCISKWKLEEWERLRVARTGMVWLWVYGGYTQPPVSVGADSPFEDKGEEARGIEIAPENLKTRNDWKAAYYCMRDDRDDLKSQITALAQFIMDEVPGEPCEDESAVQCAIRIMRSQGATSASI